MRLRFAHGIALVISSLRFLLSYLVSPLPVFAVCSRGLFPPMPLQELAVLKQCSHPFIVSLSPGGQFQTSRHLHLVLNYCPGGDLFSLLARVGRLPEPQVR